MRGFDLLGLGPYLAAWNLLLAAGVVVAVRQRARLGLFSRGYWQLLATPWRLAVFALATFSLAVIAPYTGDPTWDYADATIMSALTYATGPWVVGTLFRALARRAPVTAAELYVAAIAWMTSASWSYDLYILLRDRVYPLSAMANIPASSVLYLSGALFFSLDWRPGRGVTFAFLEPDWPSPGPRGALPRLLPHAFAFMALVVGTIAWVFLLPQR